MDTVPRLRLYAANFGGIRWKKTSISLTKLAFSAISRPAALAFHRLLVQRHEALHQTTFCSSAFWSLSPKLQVIFTCYVCMETIAVAYGCFLLIPPQPQTSPPHTCLMSIFWYTMHASIEWTHPLHNQYGEARYLKPTGALPLFLPLLPLDQWSPRATGP